MMMLRIFIPWMNETAWDRRKIFNDVLNDLHTPPKMKWAGM